MKTYPALRPVPVTRFDDSYRVLAAGQLPDGRILVVRPDGGFDIQPADGSAVDAAVFEASSRRLPVSAGARKEGKL